MQVTVLGSGIVGLWTAHHLVRHNFDVCVISDTDPTTTSSAVAASVLTPFLASEPNTPPFAQQVRWFEDSLRYIKGLEIFDAACDMVTCVEFGAKELLENSFHVSKLDHLNFSKFKRHDLETEIAGNEFGIEYQCYLCNPLVMIPWLVEDLRKNGVQFVRSRIESIQDLDSYRDTIIVNCLGYQNIFEDASQFPVFGQSMFLPCDNSDGQFFGIGSGDHGIFRHRSGYYIGSYFVMNDNSTLPKKQIFDQSCDFLASEYGQLCESVGFPAYELDPSKISWVRTGIRPFRKHGPRLVYEELQSLRVVHNYGHGAHGWTLSCATGLLAVDLVAGALYGCPEKEKFDVEIGDLRLSELREPDARSLDICATLMSSSSPWSDLRYSQNQCYSSLSREELSNYVLRDSDDDIVGFMSVLKEGVSDEPMLEYLCLAPEVRGRGIGTKLVNFFTDVLFPTASNLFLFVSDINPRAKQLYERLGFEHVGDLQNYNLTGQTEFLMRLSRRPRQE